MIVFLVRLCYEKEPSESYQRSRSMNERERRWGRAARSVYAGRLIVEVQRLRVARLAAEGKSDSLAEQLLQTFTTSLELFDSCERWHRKILIDDSLNQLSATAGPTQLTAKIQIQ